MPSNDHQIKFPDGEEPKKENWIWKTIKDAVKLFFVPLVWMWHKIRLPQFPKNFAAMNEFEDFNAMIKKNYPIRYFLFDRVPWHIRMFWKWKIAEKWYELKCYVWHRHNTVEAKTLSRTYHDIPELMLHINFQMLIRIVDEEGCFKHIEWEGNGPALSSVAKEIRGLYQWWKVDRPKREKSIWEDRDDREKVSLGDLLHPDEEIQNRPDVLAAHSYYAEIREREIAAGMEDDCQLIRLMKIRHYLWT